MAKQGGLVAAYLLDGKGGGRLLDWQALREWRPDDGFLWVHLDRRAKESRRWLRENSAIAPEICDTLLSEEGMRPRSRTIADNALVILRGVNLNPGANPDDMVAIRLWIEPHRAISLRHRRLMAIQDLRDSIEAGQGPCDAGDFLADVAGKLAYRMAPVITNLDDEVGKLEADVIDAKREALKTKLAGLRRQAIQLRRYIAPQRDAMVDLGTEKVAWLDDRHHGHLQETANRISRFVEDLDASRERGQITQDEIATLLSEQMNRNTYLLSVVAAIVLPPSLVAGVLGINVKVIPFSDHPWAFAIVCGVLIGAAAIQFWVFRRLKWI